MTESFWPWCVDSPSDSKHGYCVRTQQSNGTCDEFYDRLAPWGSPIWTLDQFQTRADVCVTVSCFTIIVYVVVAEVWCLKKWNSEPTKRASNTLLICLQTFLGVWGIELVVFFIHALLFDFVTATVDLHRKMDVATAGHALEFGLAYLLLLVVVVLVGFLFALIVKNLDVGLARCPSFSYFGWARVLDSAQKQEVETESASVPLLEKV